MFYDDGRTSVATLPYPPYENILRENEVNCTGVKIRHFEMKGGGLRGSNFVKPWFLYSKLYHLLAKIDRPGFFLFRNLE